MKYSLKTLVVCGAVFIFLVAGPATLARPCQQTKICGGQLIWCETWGDCDDTMCREVPRGVECQCKMGDDWFGTIVPCPPMN